MTARWALSAPNGQPNERSHLASDIDRAIRFIRETGETLQSDPEWRSLIIEPIEVMGVDMLAFDAAGIGIGHKGAYLAS